MSEPHKEDLATFAGADLTTWVNFPWPEWVPFEVRKQIEEFWALPGRDPRQWLENGSEKYNDSPPFGTVGMFHAGGASGDVVTGRYVHAWNHVGRVVLDDGGYVVVFGGLVQLEELARLKQPTECDLRLERYRDALRDAIRPLIEKEWVGNEVMAVFDKVKP